MEQWIDDYLLSKIGAEKDYQEEWQAYRYLIRGKMFAMHGEDKAGNEILTLKLSPEHGEEVREIYPEIITPGYYMNKRHWNSILLKHNLSESVLKKMIDESHGLILSAFSKKIQQEITGS